MSGPLAPVVDARSGQRRGESPLIPEEPINDEELAHGTHLRRHGHWTLDKPGCALAARPPRTCAEAVTLGRRSPNAARTAPTRMLPSRSGWNIQADVGALRVDEQVR